MTHVPSAERRRSQPPDDEALLASGMDALTGLLNRETLLEVLHRRTEGHLGTPLPFALLTLGLDQFDALNAAHGPAIGDALLRAVADRLRSETRAADVAARLGADSFVVPYLNRLADLVYTLARWQEGSFRPSRADHDLPTEPH